MKVFEDVKQQTPEWFKLKWGKIGGTASSGLLIDTETLLIDILSQRSEDYVHVETYKSDAMIRGNELEPLARAWVGEFAEVEFQEVGWIQSSDNELLGMSPDGISKDRKTQIEIKCFERKEHYRVITEDDIPKKYLPQCLHAFTVNPKLERLFWVAYRPESPRHYIKELKKSTILDLGWKKKEEIPQFGVKGQPIKPKIVTSPDLKTISEWAEIARQKGKEFLEEVKEVESKVFF